MIYKKTAIIHMRQYPGSWLKASSSLNAKPKPWPLLDVLISKNLVVVMCCPLWTNPIQTFERFQ
jgi:hypothetical protein